MIVLAIDPGPTTCGVVLYDSEAKRVLYSESAATVAEVIARIDSRAPIGEPQWPLIAIERVQAQGQSGASLLRTSEVVGRCWEAALGRGYRVRLVYRREVLKALDVTGRGSRDAMVRARLIEIHGGHKVAAVGTKKAPGPCYGVSSHAWAALGVAVAAAGGAGEVGL